MLARAVNEESESDNPEAYTNLLDPLCASGYTKKRTMIRRRARRRREKARYLLSCTRSKRVSRVIDKFLQQKTELQSQTCSV